MTQPKESLYWRRRGLLPLVAVGVLAAVMTTGLSLQKGFQEGYAQGIQALETGQVQIQSPQGKFVPYFMARSLAESLQGVVASSSRLDFYAQVSGKEGTNRLVHIRACNFAQETKVTGWAARVTPRGSTLNSGLILSRELGLDPRWADVETLSISDPQGQFETVRVPVSGTVTVSAGRLLDQIVYLDLGSAQGLMGSGTPVTAVALRLENGIDPERWVEDHRQTFRNFELILRPWKEISGREIPPRATVTGTPVSLLGAVVLLAALGMILIGFRSRRPRSGLSLVLRGGRSGWLRTTGIFLGGYLLATIVLVGLVSLTHRWLFESMEVNFPFVGPSRALWSGDPGLLVFPTLVVVGSFVVALWRQRSRFWSLSARAKKSPDGHS